MNEHQLSQAFSCQCCGSSKKMLKVVSHLIFHSTGPRMQLLLHLRWNRKFEQKSAE
ncbi:hypothetical protein AOLI_G00160340 [Acnodon oligacanthus]